MYRMIIASSSDDATVKLAEKILDFLDTQCNYARQHSFLLHEMPMKSFRRTISGRAYIFKLVKGTFTATCEGETLGSINLNQGYKSTDATKFAQKIMKHSQN